MATVRLQTTVGVLNQARWPGAGDVDDCWCLADFQALLAVAPWIVLPGIPAYRAAAGNPDLPGPTGGTIAHSRRAIRALFPELDIEATDGEMAWPALLELVRAGRPASLAVVSGALPPRLQFGFAGKHRVMVWSNGAELRVLNPLAPAHSRGLVIEPAALRNAVEAWGAGVRAVIMPTAAAAFRGHPLYAEAIAEARRAEFRRQAAGARVALVPLEG